MHVHTSDLPMWHHLRGNLPFHEECHCLLNGNLGLLKGWATYIYIYIYMYVRYKKQKTSGPPGPNGSAKAVDTSRKPM